MIDRYTKTTRASGRCDRTEEPAAAAFTLVELLAVIAVIGILAAIIIPVVSQVRKTASNTACVSNLRQLGNAIFLYAADNKGTLPSGWRNDPGLDNLERPWMGAIIGYIDYGSKTLRKLNENEMRRCVLFCPKAIDNLSDPSLFTGTANYSYNHHGVGGATPKKIGDCDHASRLALIGEPRINGAGTNWDNLLSNSSWSTINLTADIHGNHSNVLYLDGHVAAIKQVPPATDLQFWRY